MADNAIDFERLRAPFPATDVEWRIGRAGEKNGKVWATCLAYITARAIQDRLDEVFGPGGWKNEYRAGPAGGVICRIHFRTADGEWAWREDGAENTEIEGVKGGLSGALKRAGAALGIGRYLYGLDEGFAKVHDGGSHYGKANGKGFKWDPPTLPAWALPDGASRKPERKPSNATTPEEPTQNGSNPTDDVPACPACGGPCWDNRPKKASGQYKPNAADFACKNRDDCNTSIWIKADRDSLKRGLEQATQAKILTDEQYEMCASAIREEHAAKIVKAKAWLEKRMLDNQDPPPRTTGDGELPLGDEPTPAPSAVEQGQ